MDSEMATPTAAAAMATVIVARKNRSRMMISFALRRFTLSDPRHAQNHPLWRSRLADQDLVLAHLGPAVRCFIATGRVHRHCPHRWSIWFWDRRLAPLQRRVLVPGVHEATPGDRSFLRCSAARHRFCFPRYSAE